MKRIAAVMIVVGIAFAEVACVSAQTQGGAATSPPCDGTGTCKVDVSVVQCLVTPNPRSLNVRARNINIFWDMSSGSPDYRFNDGDGIKLKPNQPDQSEFDQPESQANGKRFKLHDKNSKAKPGERISYQYNIKVQREIFGRWYDCPVHDPIIVNEGS